MLTFVCFKWRRSSVGVQLPSACEYTALHVNRLWSMLKRHVRIDHQLVCVTVDPDGICADVRTIPIWDKLGHLGGCYNRLWVFSKEAGELFGDRFVCIDLDVVIVNDSTSLFTRKDDFVINAYNPSTRFRDQHYNGSMFMMDAGARSSVWDDFDPEVSPIESRNNPDTVGTDQSWIRHHLGKNESRWTNADGVYEARQIRHALPDDAKIVFFSGRMDPSVSRAEWVRSEWW